MWFKRKVVQVDVLEQAHQQVSNAVGMFQVAHDQISEATETIKKVRDEEYQKAQQLLGRCEAHDSHIEQYEKTKAKLAEFLVK